MCTESENTFNNSLTVPLQVLFGEPIENMAEPWYNLYLIRFKTVLVRSRAERRTE